LVFAVFSLSAWLAAPMLLISFAIGLASHLILDVTNKKRGPAFYPFGQGFCLGWCYPNRTTNSVLLWLGRAYITGYFVMQFV
jgi:inner membrane protein